MTRVLRSLVPPVLGRAWRRWKPKVYVWEGVYPTRADVPTHRAEYSGELVDEMVSTTRAGLAALERGEEPMLWHRPMALIGAAIAAERKGIRVLDFGGATGSGYVQLRAALPRATAIDYLVVDSPELCNAGRRLFANDSHIQFVDELPPARELDLIYINSVLPYIDDYRAILTRLAQLKPRFLFLARLAAGRGPTFASQQRNLPGRLFAYWFLNVDEVTGILAESGFHLAFDGYSEHAYDQTNLPPTHRVERFRDLLFARA